jgi:hypothetical protein
VETYELTPEKREGHLHALQGRAGYLVGRLNVQLTTEDPRRMAVQRELDALMWAIAALKGGAR